MASLDIVSSARNRERGKEKGKKTKRGKEKEREVSRSEENKIATRKRGGSGIKNFNNTFP